MSMGLAIVRSTNERIVLWLASGGGVGFLPYIPGTLGTLVGVPISLALNRLAASEPLAAIAALAALVVLAIGLAHRAARILAMKDPGIIVVDEIAGFALASFMTESVVGLVVAFVFFRFFDIAKVSPAARFEAFSGGAGIVLDDMVAGFYTFLLLRLFSAASWI
jgi:phosphatidylglycerophosphatase A